MARWGVVFALALVIHSVPLFCLTLSAAPPPPPDDPVLAVDFDESLAALLQEPVAAGADNPAAPVPTPPATATRPPDAAPAAPSAPAPAKPMVMVPELKTPSAKPAEEPKLREPALEPLLPPPGVALDESRATKEAPKNAYLSDRNSTAADRGPKDLPRGDPYMDDGESQAIRYRHRRGEGNLPALESSPTAGSVRKEGNPDVGKGPQNLPPPPERTTVALPVPEKSTQPVAAKPETRDPKPDRPVERAVASRATPDTAIQPPRAPADGGLDAAANPPRVLKPEPASRAPEPPAARPEAAPPDAAAPRIAAVPQTELDAFKQFLENAARPGNDDGARPGVRDRPGARGHEGDGSLRPGHDTAVSDVTTINLDSSAAEFDEARFAKKFDARTAYIKPLARRIDGKWKAERVARTRVRVLHGVVTFRALLRKDGTLLEANEVSRLPKDMPDEYAASAKLAIQRAAEPKSEPFPAELGGHEKLDFVFNFIY